MAASLAAIVSFSQWQFKLDTAFRTQIIHEYVNSLILQPDGKLIVSGVMRFPSEISDKRLVRTLVDGTRDESYNNSGLGGGKLAPWLNGKFYVGSGQGVRRILQSGQNDPSYILLSQSPYVTPIQGGDYHVFEDGRVLITGSHQLSDSIRGFVGSYQLIWFSNEGYLDTTRIHRQANGHMWRFTALPNGKFLCSCNCTLYDGQPVGRVFRIHGDGALDTSFLSNIANGHAWAYHAIQDGRTYLAGRFTRSQDPEDTLHIARFNEDGSLDETFIPPHFGPGEPPTLTSGVGITFIYPWHDGSLIIGGQFRSVNGQSRNSICLIDSTGALMSGFEAQGVGPFTYFSNTYATVDFITEDDQGRLYINGTYTGYNNGTINDPGQRFVSRLLVEEINVAVQEEENSRSFLIQPNPTHGSVNFTFNPAIGRSSSITIRDIHGRELATLPIREGSDRLEWNAADLAPGIYLVSFGSGGSVSTQKLVVN